MFCLQHVSLSALKSWLPAFYLLCLYLIFLLTSFTLIFYILLYVGVSSFQFFLSLLALIFSRFLDFQVVHPALEVAVLA